uniref:Uncharacterized protein n=1 Tax=Karlodinium veneficum TaxID=407301 RepID=A7YXY2_KARVE|nr:conserved hypothetical protein [Karlodinium veneficum]ABV22262.1 conserved hypothetical protein [Karlodinium veneficum]|mmetsp:Transcript_23029/g.36765  ORF Transcript_23029/g.36765 Transcript_23029/m.36765 type:complete len:165 (+) Transcript_23029:62-556(+)
METLIGYKVVARVGERFYSIWAGENAEYRIGFTARDEARPRHRGGLYVCRSPQAAVRHRIPAKPGGLFVAPRALLRCACEGPFVEYPGGKIACSTLTPLEEMPMPDGFVYATASVGSARAPSRPATPAAIRVDRLREERSSAMRSETEMLEAEVAEMERRLGYR